MKKQRRDIIVISYPRFQSYKLIRQTNETSIYHFANIIEIDKNSVLREKVYLRPLQSLRGNPYQVPSDCIRTDCILNNSL